MPKQPAKDFQPAENSRWRRVRDGNEYIVVTVQPYWGYVRLANVAGQRGVAHNVALSGFRERYTPVEQVTANA